MLISITIYRIKHHIDWISCLAFCLAAATCAAPSSLLYYYFLRVAAIILAASCVCMVCVCVCLLWNNNVQKHKLWPDRITFFTSCRFAFFSSLTLTFFFFLFWLIFSENIVFTSICASYYYNIQSLWFGQSIPKCLRPIENDSLTMERRCQAALFLNRSYIWMYHHLVTKKTHTHTDKIPFSAAFFSSLPICEPTCWPNST